MHICDHCKEQVGADEPDAGRPFPAFTVSGGLLGSLGAAATGSVILVPVALVAGVLADSRRCDLCEGPIEDGESGYRMMTSRDDDLDGQVFRPVAGSASSDHAGQGPTPTGSRQAFPRQGHWQTDASSPFEAPPEEEQDPQPRQDFIFDHMEGKLIERDSEFGSNDPLGVDVTPPPDSGPSAEFGEPGVPGPGELGDEPFGGLEDLSLDTMDAFEPFDLPPIEEPLQ